jgi:hypothetical protein
MKHTLRCHGFGEEGVRTEGGVRAEQAVTNKAARQNRASPQGVAAKIAASFVARLANIDILAAPRFALSTIFSRNAHAFHCVRDSGRG